MFAKALSLALVAGTAMAGPITAGTTIAPGDKFVLTALRSASPIHFASVSAAKRSIFLNLPSQGATCDDGSKPTDPNFATFTLSEDGGLYLYAASATPQQLFADRSGMGQGKLGYTTGAEPGPKNGERTGFVVDEYGDLTLGGSGFVACPSSIDGAWSVWVSTGVANPGGNSDCLGFSARASKIETAPNSCLYTS